MSLTKNKIAILASGSGSNAENIIRHFRDSEVAEVCFILCNKADAYVFQRAKALGVPAYYCPKEEWQEGGLADRLLREGAIDWVVLAGFLLLVPSYLTARYANRMVNIHPALLPSFGGKGMYGAHVHQAVKASGVDKTGITIHYVNDHFDRGAVIFQASVPVEPSDTPDRIAEKVHELEGRYFPSVIESLLTK